MSTELSLMKLRPKVTYFLHFALYTGRQLSAPKFSPIPNFVLQLANQNKQCTFSKAVAGSCLGPSTYSFCPCLTVPLNTLANAMKTWSQSVLGGLSGGCLVGPHSSVEPEAVSGHKNSHGLTMMPPDKTMSSNCNNNGMLVDNRPRIRCLVQNFIH